MSVVVGTAAGARDVVSIHVGAGGEVKAISEGWIGAAGVKQKFYSAAPPLAVEATPGSMNWQMITPGSFYVSASDAAVSVSGGVAPYTYSWSTNNGGASVNSPSSPTTGFQSSDGYVAIATCTVTDGEGATADSNGVEIS